MYRIIYQLTYLEASILKDIYNGKENDNNPYLFFTAKVKDISISCYKDKKSNYKVIYTSNDKDNLLKEVRKYNSSITIKNIIDDDKKNDFVVLSKQIGSDEVGKGDFFGPLIVVSSFVEEKDLKLLEELRITDSKKISDEHHLEVGKILKRKIKNYSICVSPLKLSKMNEEGININKTLALLHNLSHQKLIDKYNLSSDIPVFVDQFESLTSYRNQLKDEIIKNNLFFQTQGETHYPSVAASSCIARYLFLTKWKEMEEKFNTTIPKGASSDVNKAYLNLRKTYSKEELKPYVKTFFQTYNNVEK